MADGLVEGEGRIASGKGKISIRVTNVACLLSLTVLCSVNCDHGWGHFSGLWSNERRCVSGGSFCPIKNSSSIH